MSSDYLNFTAFFDETGSITNDTPEIFGGSLFIIEDSEIDKCRYFLKKNYTAGIHCKELRSKKKLLKISEEVGAFLRNKNCLAVTMIQVNKNLMKECELIFLKKYNRPPKEEDLSLIKRYLNYAFILRYSLIGVHSLIQQQPLEKVTVSIFMENVVRNENLDRKDLHSLSFKSSVEENKHLYLPQTVKKTVINEPKSKTKKEEIMFSFPDLFAYSIRRIVTHKEYGLYDRLKHIFNKCSSGYCSRSELFDQQYPGGILICHLTAEEIESVI